MDLTVIVPCFNERKNLETFLPLLTSRLEESGASFELVIVDDGSQDDSATFLKSFASAHDQVTAIVFSRNFGKESALYAGISQARGDVLGIIDADHQQNPATLIEMYRTLCAHPECDCVAGVQQPRDEGALIGFCKHRFYRLFNIASDDIKIIEDASDFRVFRRCVADALLKMPEYFRFSKGLFAWVGFSTYTFPYKPDRRASGKSTWSFRALCAYAFEGILSFSTVPLRISTVLGGIASLIAVIYLIQTLVETIFFGVKTPGYPTIVCLILLFGGMMLIVLGIIGEYLARIYIEGKHRPIYITRAVWRSANLHDPVSDGGTHDHT